MPTANPCVCLDPDYSDGMTQQTASPTYVRHLGRYFLVMAQFPEADTASANAFMTATPGAAALAVIDGTIYLADQDDKGIAAATPAAIVVNEHTGSTR